MKEASEEGKDAIPFAFESEDDLLLSDILVPVIENIGFLGFLLTLHTPATDIGAEGVLKSVA